MEPASGRVPGGIDLGCDGPLIRIGPEDLRDPLTALPLAERAKELAGEKEAYGKDTYDLLETLASAYHVNGDTARAIEIQRKVLSLVPAGELGRKTKEERLAEFEAALEKQSTSGEAGPRPEPPGAP